MTVKEFVKKYNELTSSSAKEMLVKKIVKSNHKLSFVKNKTLADNVAKQSCTNVKDGSFKIDTIANMYLSSIALLTSYTDLELHKDTYLEDYELLNKFDLVNVLISEIDNNERESTMLFIRLATEDYIANNSGALPQLSALIDRIGTVLPNMIQSMSDDDKSKITNMIQDRIK